MKLLSVAMFQLFIVPIILTIPPYENLGLPCHSYFKTDQKPIPTGEPIELVFDLLPTAQQFSKGSRIRAAMACADADNFILVNPPALPGDSKSLTFPGTGSWPGGKGLGFKKHRPGDPCS